MKQTYVTAFPGRRDHYQIPLALAENGRLAGFATCFYRNRGVIGRFLAGNPRVRARFIDGVPGPDVESMEFVNIAARIGQRILQPSRVGVWEDNAFARRAVALARRRRSGLMLYEFQADWAFRQPLNHAAARILFQFHPHPDFEHPLLLADGAQYPRFLARIRRDTRANLSAGYRRHTRGAWRHADHVIVASSFTARSLEFAGCPASRITVVPYGCGIRPPPGADAARTPLSGRPFFLFVGSGTHRKGLHHLLEAWGRSPLFASHELVIIARVVDPELRELLASAKSVRHIAGVSGPELAQWYRAALAFVLPSLSEGFGHVFLEALTCGCPVIGTRNSMLPDLAGAQDHIRYVVPGDPEGIRAEMERVAALPATDAFFRTGALGAVAKDWTLKRFRDGLESVLQRFDR